ncbi:hypothetical protein LOTGIDRAFT_231250, partial [Lottia gigantea]
MASSYRTPSLSASSYFPDYTSTVGTVVERPSLHDRMKDVREFFYHVDNNGRSRIFGKRADDFFLSFIFHVVIILVCLALLTAKMAIFYVVLDWNYPTYNGTESILQTPGLTFRPQPNSMSTVIRFVKGDTTTYAHYLDHMEAYLRYYENEKQQGENYMDCSEIRERRRENLNKVCRFNVEWLGADCVKQQNFGFDDGQPCVLLKLNKIYGWEPEEYPDDLTIPDSIRDHWNTWSITVTCEGENAADKENIGTLYYFPPNGFHFKYYPYLNQQG